MICPICQSQIQPDIDVARTTLGALIRHLSWMHLIDIGKIAPGGTWDTCGKALQTTLDAGTTIEELVALELIRQTSV